jgi:uncharacterized membrane protein
MNLDADTGLAEFPGSLHKYSYVLNNPALYTDPLGNHPALILGMAPWVVVLSLYIALGWGLYHEFHRERPGVSTASRICIGLVKGFAIWGALLPFAALFTYLATWAVVYIAYFAGELGVFATAMGYIWFYVQNHQIWSGIAFGVLMKAGFEMLAEYALEKYTDVMERLEYGAVKLCAAD